MSAKELLVPIRVGGARGGFAATTELAGTPICCYGATADEAARKTKGAALRLLGGIVERGTSELVALRFEVKAV